jgi:hypothetical protein
MTIDERLAFLLQSTESLHTSVQELTGNMQTLREVATEHTKQLRIDADNIRSLANIAAGARTAPG